MPLPLPLLDMYRQVETPLIPISDIGMIFSFRLRIYIESGFLRVTCLPSNNSGVILRPAPGSSYTSGALHFEIIL